MNNIIIYIVFILLGLMIGIIACVCLFEKIEPVAPKRKSYSVTLTFKHTYNIWAYNKDSAIEEALRQAKELDDVYWESEVTNND